MFELTLTPAHGLKQSVDYPLQITYPPDRGIQSGDMARMELRYALDDAAPVDTLGTEGGRIVLGVGPDGAATLTLHLTGEASAAYPITKPDGGSRYRKLKAEEAPTLDDASAYKVLPLFGTLIVSSPGGQDRQGTALDLRLLFEAAYTRGGTL